MTWLPGTFYVAFGPYSPDVRAGYLYRGLALHVVIDGSPEGRRPPTWKLTHIGSGHAICMIDGKVSDAFPIASEIAECADWSFDGLEGWKNVDPELPKKLGDVLAKHGKRIRRGGGGSSNSEAARQVVMANLA